MANEMRHELSDTVCNGLALFSLDFTSKGLSLGGAMCNKWGNLRLDNIVAQTCDKYVSTVGDHFREVLEEVANHWSDPSSAIVDGLASLLSLENVPSEICRNSRGRNDGYHHDERLPLYSETDVTKYNAKDLNSATLAIPSQDMKQKKKTYSPVLSEDWRSMRECHKNVSEAVASLDCARCSHPSDGSPLTELHHNGVIEGGSMISICAIQMGDAAKESQESLDLETVPSVHEAVDDSTESKEEFEDIKLEEFEEGAVQNELTLILHSASKGTPYKRKLKNMFRLKPPSSNWSGANDGANAPVMLSSQLTSESSSSSTITSHSHDGDWELL